VAVLARIADGQLIPYGRVHALVAQQAVDDTHVAVDTGLAKRPLVIVRGVGATAQRQDDVGHQTVAGKRHPLTDPRRRWSLIAPVGPPCARVRWRRLVVTHDALCARARGTRGDKLVQRAARVRHAVDLMKRRVAQNERPDVRRKI